MARAGLGAAAGGGGRGEAGGAGIFSSQWVANFFECPLIRAQEYLLQFLIEMWSPAQHCFLVRGEKVAFTTEEDIYFLTGLPFRGTPLPTFPVLPRETDLVVVAG
jgi:hypothetical protein